MNYELNTFQIEPDHCVNCHKELDAASGVGHKEMPEEGSVTVCYYCGHIMGFDANKKLRELTDEEMIEVAGHPTVLAVINAIGEARKENEKAGQKTDPKNA